MNGKLNRKIFNFRNIIVSLIIVVVAAISGISIVQYNSNNANTNLAKAQNSNYPIKGSQLVNEALKYLGKSGSEIDCSRLINLAIADCGGSGIKGGSSAGWNEHYFTYNFKGTTFEPKEIGTYTDKNGTKTTWYSKIANVDELPIGTVVSGHGDGNTSGHVFIYIGKASTYDELRTNIKNQYKIDLPANDGNKNKFDIRGGNDSTGGQYWYIEGNTVEHVRIRNFNWNVKNDNDVKNMKYIKVWKITENDSPSSYSIRVTKNGGIAGAKFVTLRKINNAYSDTTETTTKAGTYQTVTGLKNMNEKGDITVDKEGLDVYKIYESEQPNGYKNDWKNGIYLGVKKELKDNQYQITKVAISKNESDVTNENSGKWTSATGNTQQIRSIDGLIVNFHGIGNTSDGKYNQLGVISLFFDDTRETPQINSYNVSITKVDENGNVIPNASFTSSYHYEEPANTFDKFAQEDSYIDNVYLVNDDYEHNKSEFSVNSGDSIIKNVTIGSGTKNGSGVGSEFTLGANAAKLANPNLRFSQQEYTYFIGSHIAIKDVYRFSENKVDGYVRDYKKYTLEIEKYYDQQYTLVADNGVTYWGRISKVSISDGTTTVPIEFKYNGNKLQAPNQSITVGNATVNINIYDNGGANIDIKLKNKSVEGSYKIYYGKKSQYEDLSKYTASTEIQGTKNLNGANFTVKKYLDGNLDMEHPDDVVNVTSEGKKWEYFTVNTKSLQTDRFRIIENLPPDQYAEGMVSQVWIDVYKTETDNKIVVDHMEISFRDKNGNFVRKNEKGEETTYYYKSNESSIGNCANGWFQFEQPNGVFKAIFVFQNPKKYGLQIVKKDADGEIISSDKGNANFSIKMFTKISKDETNNTISVDELHKIKSSEFDANFERKDAVTENLDTVDGVLNLGSWIVEESMLGNTYYYLVTENVSPIGYNSIGSLIIGIHFDADGNSSIESMYHVSGGNGYTFNIKDSAQGKESLSVKVGENVTATADDSQEVKGRIDLSIQQPVTEESNYNLLLEKKDASDGNNLSGVNFEISSVKINNTDINVPETYSITSNGSANNVINEIYTNTNESGKNAIGNEEKVINKYENTDTYVIKENNSISGYELNNIVTIINFYKKTVDGNIKNNYTGVTFDSKSEKTVNDGYFVSSLDDDNVSQDDRKISNLQNYINTIQNESAVIVYYSNGRIVVQYYNKLEGTYSLNLTKKIKSANGAITDTTDSSIKFNIKLYKTKSENNEFSDEVITVNKKEESVALANLTNAQSITSELQDILITKNDENKTYYYVLEETDTRTDLIKLDYRIVVPIKFEKDSTIKKYVAKLDGKAFGLKTSDNSKIDLDEKVSVDVNNSIINIVDINNEKTGKYNLQVLKVNKNTYSDYTAINSAFENGTLYENGIANAVIGIRKSSKNGDYLNTTESKIITENKKPTKVYDNSIEILSDDFIVNTTTGILEYSIREITSPEGFKLNTNSSNIFIVLKNEDTKYSITDAYIYGLSRKSAYENNGVYLNIDNNSDIPTIVFVIADTPITGNFTFNMKKINKTTTEELTEAEKAGMKFSFKLYTGGQSLDDPGTQVTELINTDGKKVDISNLTSLNEINSAMKNISITEDMLNKNPYRLIIEETTAPTGFTIFGHKIGIVLYATESDEQYVMRAQDVMIKNGSEWQNIYGTYNSNTGKNENVWTDQKVSFKQNNNELTFTLPNAPKDGAYNIRVTKTDISGKEIKNENTSFSVKAYTSDHVNKYGEGFVEFYDDENIEINGKKENELTATTGTLVGIDDILISKENIDKTYYFVIEETKAPDEFTKIDYKVVIPVTFSEIENEYKATKGEAYAVVQCGIPAINSEIYYKKSLKEVATSTTDIVSTEQTDTTINVKVPNKRSYTLKLKKIDATTSAGLSNITFNLIGAKINNEALKNANNQEVTAEPITTGSDGIANICEQTSVPNPVYTSTKDADEYYFTEVTTPEGHEKLPDDVAIKLQLNKSNTDGKITSLGLSIVNSENKQDVKQKGNTGTVSSITYNLDSGTTVTISANLDDSNGITLTVADPIENISGNYNLYIVKKDNKNTRLSGVNFELIYGNVNDAQITQNGSNLSEQNPKSIITGEGRVSVYTNGEDENNNPVINIEKEGTDSFILREKDLGKNKGYTQLPSDYKIKVEITKEKNGTQFISKKATLKLLDKSGNEVSKNENGKYTINNIEFGIDIEKSGNNITITVENPRVEGEYKLNVIKKNVNNQGSIVGFDSFGTNSVAGAKFNVTLYKGTTINNNNFNFWSSTNRVKFDEYTTTGTTEDLSHDKFKRTGVTYFDIENKMIDIWNIEETDPPTGFEAMKKSLVLGVEKSYNEATKQFSIDTIHIYQKDNSSIKWDPQSYEEINQADGSVMYKYVSSDNDTWQIMLNKDRTQIAVSADNIPNGEYKLNVMKKITGDNSAGDTADSARANAEFNIELYKDIDLNSSDFKFGKNQNPGNYEDFSENNDGNAYYETKGNAEDLTNDKFKRTGLTTESIGEKYDIWRIQEYSAPTGLDTYSDSLVLGVKKKFDSSDNKFKIESITMYKVDGRGIKSNNNVWEAQTIYDVNDNNASSTEMNKYTTYSYFDKDSNGNNVRRWDLVIKNNQICVTLHNSPSENGYYNVNLVKHDKYGSNVSGVKFTVDRTVNGGSNVEVYTEQNPLTTSYNAVNVGGTINIKGSEVGTDDVFILKELDIDEGYYFTKIPQKIKLTVKKATRTNSDDSKTHYVSGVELRLIDDNGQEIQPTETGNKSVVETTVNGEKANITAELIDNTITLTVVNPDKIGLYSLDLAKVEKGTNTSLDGAEFEVKYYNSMSTQNETESVNVLNSDGTISTVKTSEIKTVADFKKLQNIIVNESTASFSYWIIKETKAPAGHDLLKYDIEIRIFKQDSSDGYKVSSDRARALYEDGTNKLLEDLTEDEPKTTFTEDKESSTYKLNINVENAITPKGTYSLNLNKIDKATKNNLTGAEFEVSLKSGRTKMKSVTIVNDDNTETTIDLSTIKSVDDFNKLKNIKITSEGKLVWQIKETKAPEGFKKLDYYISITFNSKIVNNNYVIEKESADAIWEGDGSYRSTPIEAIDKNEPQTTITETTTGTYQANITIENNSYDGNYKLSLMKKDEADLSNGYGYGDDSRSALAGATFDVKLYKNIQKNNNNFEFNSQYNEENKGPYTTVGPDDISEEIVRDGLTSSGFDSNYYDIWKIEETKSPDGYTLMTAPLVLGVEKNYDSTTNTFTINDIYVYQKNSNGLKSDGGKWVVLPVTNRQGSTAHDENGNAMVPNSTYIFEQDGNTWSIVLTADKTKMIVTAFDKKTTKYTIQKVWADGTETPKNLEVRLYSFDKDNADYKELVGYVNSKDYDKINEKVKTLSISGPSVYLSADENWSHTWGGLDPNKSYFAWETDTNALAKYKIIDASVSADGTGITIKNTEEEGQYDLNIQKRSTSGEILNGVEFSLMSAKVNNETVKNSKGETATNEKFVTSSVGIANVPSLTSVPNPIKITDVDNADVYVFRETNLPESIKNKYAKLPDYVSIELTVNKGRAEVDGKTQLVPKSVSVKIIDNRTNKEYVGNRNNIAEYTFESNGKTYTAKIKASLSDNTVTLTVENPDIPPEGEYKLSLVKAGDDERLGGVKFNLISARVNNGTISNGSSNVSEDNPIVITTNAQKTVGIWPTDGSSMKILSVTSDEYILKEADLGNNNKYVKLPDNKLIKLVILKEETNNEFKVSSINMYVGNDTDGWEPATYIFNEAHNMIIEAKSTVTDNKGNEFTISFTRSGDNLTLTVEDPKEETTKYTVSKKWDDDNKTDSRPDYVEFRLFGFAKNDAEAQKVYKDLNNCLQNKAYSMISSKIKDKSILQYKYTGDINVRADDGWQEATWYNLSKDYNYFAWEISDIDEYDITNAEVSNNNTKLTITNKKDTTKYTIQKVWADGTEMPKNLEVQLYSFDKDSQDYNELVGYVNSKDYDKINEKVKTLTPSGPSVYLWPDTNWSHTWGGLEKDRSYFAWEIDKDALVKYNITDAEISEEGTKMTITNTKPVSKFNFRLVKYEQDSENTLSGALFEITIKDENGNPLKTVNGTEINKYQQTTSATYGRISFDDIIIDGADKKYTVEITEVVAPAGYERIMDTISFQVTSKLADDGSYMLTPGDYTVANTKQCEVDENGNVIVTVEDKKTDKTEFAVYKKWANVKDTELPDSITVELYQVPENKLDAWNIVKEDADARQEYLYRGAYGTGGQVTLTKADAVNGNNLMWYHKWTGLSKENNNTKVKNIYYVIETDGPEGFITTYEPNNYKSPDVNTVTITNTKETTHYTIQKVWDKNVQTSSIPRTLQVSLFAFDKNDENDTNLYNELIGYVNNKQYNEINNKIAELTDKKVGSSIGLSAGNQWSFTWSELSKDNNYFAWETDANALSKFNITNAVISDEETKMTITNTQPEGSFKLKLIKKLTNTNITLANAKFTLSIKDEAGNELIPNTSYEYKTDANGEIVVDKLAITGANKEYTVTIKETEAPAGYVKLTDEVSFKVKSHAKADGSGFELIANDLTPIKNAKDAKVTEDGIEVTIYNDLTPPHKGVKDIKNQDSGYYDNVTGKVYTSREEVASTLHDWVIQTTIPEGITAYTTYEISDEINEKLVFAGLDTVKVKYVNGADLTKDKDYKVTYDEASRMLKVTFVDESFKGGYNLEVGKDVEIRFNTTFALDSDGNIIAINEEVPNQAKLTYGNDSNNKQTKLTEIPEVHTGGVGIYKYDKKTNKALEGAHFKIATSKENALAGIFVKDGNGQDIEKITNSNGVAEFAGLEFGEDALNNAEYEVYDSITGAKVYKYDTSKLSTKYYLVETESPKGYLKLEEPIEVVVKVGSYDMKDITSLVQVGNEEGIYDLSLRKFITAVKDTAKGTEEEVTSRIPQVDLTKLASGESTTATYTHPKDPVLVHTTDIVTYTIRIYNEGPQDAYASIVKDDIPDGLQFVQYTEGDGSLNAEYRWKLVDENDNEVTDVSKAKYIVTDYLSKEQDKTPGANLLKAYKPETMSKLDYRDVKVQFRVTEPTTSDRILINYAQISKETDSSGRIVRDRDSTPNVWVEGEDDQDIEKVRVQYFDLALRKWVTQAIVTENGKTVVTQTGHKAEDDPEEVVKVDLKKSKINNVVVKFRYSIRITNEGEIAGEATEIRDDIPQGLKFVAEDNPDWREENGQIVTNKLEHTTLQPGESAEVEILLTWINSENNMGVMTNVAEINKDHNDYGAPDIDSTPGNNVPGEDDIDDAPVMLTVKTGSEYILYVGIALSAIAVIAVGGKVIKKKVMRNI